MAAETVLRIVTDDDPSNLVNITKDYLDQSRMTIADLAVQTGISRSALSKYLSGKYDASPVSIEQKLRTVLAKQGISTEEKSIEAIDTGKKALFESRDALSIMGICSSCQEYLALGVVIGRSGYGKTYTLKQYAKLPKVCYIECDDTMGGRDLIEAVERTIGIAQTYGSIWSRVNIIRAFFNKNPGHLLIVDEADKLLDRYSQKKMEILRGIKDQCNVGMVVAGEPRLEPLLKKYLPRFANRVDFFYSLNGLARDEVDAYLQEYIVDPDALAELQRRATNANTGCFRLLDRTLRNIIRIMREERMTKITIDVIRRASDMMLL